MHTLTKKEIPEAIKILKRVKKITINNQTKYLCIALNINYEKHFKTITYTVHYKLKSWIQKQLKHYSTLEQWIANELGIHISHILCNHNKLINTRLAWINSMIKQLQGELK